MSEKRMNGRILAHRGLAMLLCLLSLFSVVQPGLTTHAATYYCGYEEHVHTDDCYKTVTEMQPVKELNCTYVEPENAHKHEGACYKVLDCDKPVVEAHIHGYSCYAGGVESAANLTCTKKEAHVHDEFMCYSGGKLICGKEEAHTHDEDACYRPAVAGETGILVCTEKALKPHEHDASCYIIENKPVSARVLECTKTAHTHNSGCTVQDNSQPSIKIDTTGFSQRAMDMAEALSILEWRTIKFKKMSSGDAGYASTEELLMSDFETFDIQLNALYSAGEILDNEYNAVNDELFRVFDLLFADVGTEDDAMFGVEGTGGDYYMAGDNGLWDRYNPLIEQTTFPGKDLTYVPYTHDEFVLARKGADSVKSNGWSESDNANYDKQYHVYVDDADAWGYDSNGEYISVDNEAGFKDCDGSMWNAESDNYYDIVREDGDEKYAYVDYINVGTYNGRKVDLRISIWDYALTTNRTKWEIWNGNTKVANWHTAQIGITSTGTGLDVAWGIPGVVVKDVAWVELKYEYFWNDNSAPVAELHGSTSYYDIDCYQGIHLQNTSGGAATVEYLLARNDSQVCQLAFDHVNGDAANSPCVYEYDGVSSNATTGDPAAVQYGFTECFVYKSSERFHRTFFFGSANRTAGAQYHDGTPVYPKGTLEIGKKVSNSSGLTAADQNQVFWFKIQLNSTDANIHDPNGTYGGIKFTNNVAWVSLKHNQTVKLTGIAKGVRYTVTEVKESGSSTAYNGEYTPDATQKSGTMTDGLTRLTFTNTRKSATITVKKVMGSGSTSKTFTFDYYVNGTKKGTLSIAGGGSKTFTVTSGDQVYVKETNNNGYSTTSTVTGVSGSSGVQSATFSANGQTVTFTNTEKKAEATITIKKTLTAADSTQARTFEFEIKEGNTSKGKVTVTVPKGQKEATGTFKLSYKGSDLAGNASKVFNYTVTELDTNITSTTVKKNTGTQNFSVTLTNTSTGMTATPSPATVTFSNTILGSLTVKKTVSNGASETKEFPVKVTLSDGTTHNLSLHHNETATIDKIPIGTTWSISENVDGYKATYTNQTGTVKAGTNTAAVNNELLKTSVNIPVTKTLKVKDTSKAHKYTFTLYDSNGTTVLGTKEITVPANTPSVTVNDAFKIDYTGEQLGTHTYKIKETSSSTDASGTVTMDSTTKTVTVTIGVNSAKTALTSSVSGDTTNFTNTILGSLKVVKNVVPATGRQVDGDKEFTINVTIGGTAKEVAKLKDDGFKTYSQEPIGQVYSVVEAPASHYGYAVSYSSDKTGNQILSDLTTVTVTNTELTTQINGGIKIEKTLTNADSVARTYYFQVVETAPDGSTKTYDEVAVNVPAGATNGSAIFNTTYYGGALGADGKATYTYKIKELQKATPAISGIVWDESEKTVTVTVDGTRENQLTATASPASVSFNNTLLSELRIEKKVQGKTTPGKNFAMTVELDSNYFQAGETYEFTHSGEGYTFTPGVGRSASITLNITLEPDGYVVIGRVPVGATYSVQESEQSAYGYAVTYTYSNPGKVLDTSQENVTVTNTELTTKVKDLDGEAGIQIIKALTQSYGDQDHTYNFRVMQAIDMAGIDTFDTSIQITINKAGTINSNRQEISYKGSNLNGAKEREIVYKVWETDTDNDMVDIDGNVYYQVYVLLSDNKTSQGDTSVNALTAKVTAVQRIENPVWNNGVPGGGTLKSTDTNSGGTLSFTNVPLGTIKINKIVPADSQTVDGRQFQIDAVIRNEQGLLKGGMKFLVNGTEWTVTDANEQAKAMTVSTYIPRDGSILIERIPAGSMVSVSEDLYSTFGYKAEYTVDSVDDTQDVTEYTTTPITGVPLEEKTRNDDSPTLTFNVRNTELSTEIIDGDDTGIRIIKNLLNSDMEEHGPYTFNLTQVKDKDGTAMDADTVAAPADEADKSLTIEKDKNTGEFRYDITYDGYMLDTGTVDGEQKTKTFYYLATESTEDDNAVNADEREYVVEVVLTGTLNDMTAAVTGVYELSGDPKTGTSLGTGVDEVTFENILLGTIEVTKDLELFEGSTYGDAFKMWLTIEGDYIESDMLFNVNGTDYDYSKQQFYDKATLEDGKLIIEMDLKDTERTVVKKIPAGSSFSVVENGTGDKANHGFLVTYAVDGGQSNAVAAEGNVPAKKADADDIKTVATVTNAEQWADWLNEDGTAGIRVTKFITNPDNKNHTWEFELTELDRSGNVLPGGLHMVTPVTFKGDRGEAVIPVKYKTTDLNGGTIASETKSKHFYYRITEVVPDWKQSTHDPKVYTVTVMLTGSTNTLEARVTSIKLDGQNVDPVNPGINFTNTLLGSFTLEKRVMTQAGWASGFDFEITSDALDGSYRAEFNGEPTTVTFKNGVANVKLHDKDVLRVYQIPHGTELTITEYAFDFVIRHKINGGWTNTDDHTNQTITTDGVHILYLNYYDKGLPQTGQLNWPIPVLLGLGAVLIAGGIWLSRKKKKEEE